MCALIYQCSRPFFTTYGLLNSKICLNGNLPPLLEPRDIIKICYLVFLVHIESYSTLFLPLIFMACTLCTWAINLKIKKDLDT